jgi:hypothetical protein
MTLSKIPQGLKTPKPSRRKPRDKEEVEKGWIGWVEWIGEITTDQADQW